VHAPVIIIFHATSNILHAKSYTSTTADTISISPRESVMPRIDITSSIGTYPACGYITGPVAEPVHDFRQQFADHHRNVAGIGHRCSCEHNV
jgi:hypothetical protein